MITKSQLINFQKGTATQISAQRMRRAKELSTGNRTVPNLFPESNNSRNNLFYTPEQIQALMLQELVKIREILEKQEK